MLKNESIDMIRSRLTEPPGYVSLFTVITRQLSVEKAMAKRAADTREKMEAKHKVTALQKAILRYKAWPRNH